MNALILLVFTYSVQAQTISGIIKNADFKPVAGVSIKLTGTDTHVVTDNEGKFVLAAKTSAIQLEISKEGFNTEVVQPGKDRQNIEVLLIPDLASAMDKKLVNKGCRKHPLLAEL